ncbi:MAG: glycoside hydrolase family 127 protein, partial [Chitinophagaceae bacterium]
KPQWSGDPDQSLYLSSAISDDHYTVTVNGNPVNAIVENGYLKIERKWKNGDQVDFHFSMPVGLVRSKSSIQQNEDRLAIQRGPLVYCVEGSDNENKAWNIILPATTSFTLQPMQITEEKVVAVQAKVPVITVADGGTQMITQERKITAIPYYTWANRGKNEMQVWLPTRIKDIKINYIP